MREVILNDECAYCNDKECHDGEHFCNQAMKENSFYKNAKLYKGLEVIQRPTYEELEKENAELKEQISIKDIMIKELQIQKVYWKESSFDWRHKFFKLDKVKRLIKKDKQLTKATEIIKKYLVIGVGGKITQNYLDVTKEAEQFLNSEVEK